MLNRFVGLAAVCVLVPLVAPPLASAAPVPFPPIMPGGNTTPPPDGLDAAPPPLPDNGAVASGDPDVVTTGDGWTLMVSAKNETQVPVAPLTTALSSREYLVGGTFNGSARGAGSTKLTGGTLEAGYQIGCGMMLDRVEPTATLGFNPSFGATGFSGFSSADSAGAEVELFPGKVVTVPVVTAKFKGADPRVTVTNFRITIDACVGQSFLRSYATLTSSAAATDDVVSYTGVTKEV